MSTGKTIPLSMLYSSTIKNVKQKISNMEDIHPYCQQLTFNGRVLEDGHTFSVYNVQDGSTLDLMVRPESKYINSTNTCKTCYYYTVINPQPASNYLDTKRRYFPGDTAFIHNWTYQVYDSRKGRSAY